MKKRKKKLDPLVRTLERECEKYLRTVALLHESNRDLTARNKWLKALLTGLLGIKKTKTKKGGAK